MLLYGLIKFRNKGFCVFVIFKYLILDIFFKKIIFVVYKVVFLNL